MPTPAEMRREDDRRFDDLTRKVTDVAKDVTTIREMLISEPEASPLGRALLKASQNNRVLIDQQRSDFEKFRREDFEPLDDWWQQTRGAWRLVLGTGVVLGIIGSFFGLAAFFGWGS